MSTNETTLKSSRPRSISESTGGSTSINQYSQSQQSKRKLTIPHPSDDCYKMDHEQRGFAYIFNHIEDGIDQERITQTLTQLGFEVQVYEQLPYDEIVNVLREVSSMNYSNVDCLVVVVITHGGDNFLQANGATYYPDLLWTPFKGDRCPSLAGKPKLFFIDACRGEAGDKGVKVEYDGNHEYSHNANSMKIPTTADFLIVFSTQLGYNGYGDDINGSWFMHALCAELNERCESQDLLSILTFVNRRISFDYEGRNLKELKHHGTKQVSSIVSSLTRYLYLRSDHLQDDDLSL